MAGLATYLLRRRPAPLALIAALCLVAIGCRRETAAPELPPPEVTIDIDSPPPPADDGTPFAPPATLAALDRQTTWVDRPVRDAVALAREQDSREPAADTAEALAAPNDSAEANARLLAVLARAPAAGAASVPSPVVRGLVAGIDSLNPLRAETPDEFDLAELTGLDLFGFDRSREPFANADTVTSWKTSADGLVDKVVLRNDLTWSDGAPVTARDVAFTWRLIVDSRVPARAFRDPARRMRLVQAYDDRTVVFFHREPLATNAWDLDFPLLPRHAYARSWERDPTLVDSPVHRALEARPVTGGPYEVAGRSADGEIVLSRRAGWAIVRGRKVREPAPCAEIRFRPCADAAAALEAMRAGDLDEAVLDPPQWATGTTDDAFTRRCARLETPEWRSLQFAWNVDAAPFADRSVRRALGYAFDHGRLLDGLCHGMAAQAAGIFPPGPVPATARKLAPLRQDLDKAEALLDEAGWVDHDGDGVRDRGIDGRFVPCAFTVICDRRRFRVEICALLRESLKRVGVTCTVEALEPEELRARLQQRRFEACLVSWGTGVDPDTAASLWCTAGARNVCGYSNPEVDRLFAEGRRDRDPRRRAEHYARLEEILSEDQPCTWLVWHHELRAFSRRLGTDLFRIRGPGHWSPGLSSIWKPTLD